MTDEIEVVKMKPIPKHPGYFASRDGNIWSVRANRAPWIPWKLKGGLDRRGYLNVAIQLPNGKQVMRLVHRLVALTFHGEPKMGLECAHLNGNSLDNRASNLKWVTHLENMSHMVKHGNNRGGRSIPKEIKEEIRRLYKRESYKNSNATALAKTFGLSRTSVVRIAKRLL